MLGRCPDWHARVKILDLSTHVGDLRLSCIGAADRAVEARLAREQSLGSCSSTTSMEFRLRWIIRNSGPASSVIHGGHNSLGVGETKNAESPRRPWPGSSSHRHGPGWQLQRDRAARTAKSAHRVDVWGHYKGMKSGTRNWRSVHNARAGVWKRSTPVKSKMNFLSMAWHASLIDQDLDSHQSVILLPLPGISEVR